jgi:competence protein ComEC
VKARDDIPLYPLILPVLLALSFHGQITFGVAPLTLCAIFIIALLCLSHFITSRKYLATRGAYFRVVALLGMATIVLWNIQISKPQAVHYTAGHYMLVASKYKSKKSSAYNRYICIPLFGAKHSKRAYGVVLFEKKVDGTIALGSIIYLEKRPVQILSKPSDDFNFKKYYLSQGISHQVFVAARDWHLILDSAQKQSALSLGIKNTQKVVLARIESLYGDDPVLGVMQAMIIGDKRSLPGEQKAQFSALGIIHVLAVSGLHLGLLFVVLDSFLRFLKRNKQNFLYAAMHIGFAWAYALVTGFSPSVRRAAMMLSILVLGQALNRRATVLNSLFLSFIVMVILEPGVFQNIGFQLSFLAILGILLLAKPLQKSLQFRFRIFNAAWQAASVSIAAHLATFPLVMYYFHMHSNLFILSNLIIVPLFVFLLYLGFAALLMGFVFEPLATPIVALARWDYKLIERISEFLGGIPYATVDQIDLGLNGLVFFYAILIVLYLAFLYKSKLLLYLAAAIYLLAQVFI